MVYESVKLNSEIDLNSKKNNIRQITLSNIILSWLSTYVAQLHNEDKNQQSPASPCAMSRTGIHGRSARAINGLSIVLTIF